MAIGGMHAYQHPIIRGVPQGACVHTVHNLVILGKRTLRQFVLALLLPVVGNQLQDFRRRVTHKHFDEVTHPGGLVVAYSWAYLMSQQNVAVRYRKSCKSRVSHSLCDYKTD